MSATIRPEQNGSYATEDYRDRHDDVIWRVRWGQDWLYVYLLLEFQSEVDRFMAVRMMTYVGLLYQDLITQGKLTDEGRLRREFALWVQRVLLRR